MFSLLPLQRFKDHNGFRIAGGLFNRHNDDTFSVKPENLLINIVQTHL